MQRVYRRTKDLDYRKKNGKSNKHTTNNKEKKSGKRKKTVDITTAPTEYRWLPNRIIQDYTVVGSPSQLNNHHRCIFSIMPASEVSCGR
ncbi:hypothetical protein Bca4012_084871 [Brassica carinata]|uniref:Uncharacterized protein n=1 Tax=Brassica carinata TaxID=52824 RepID=A0A8X7V9L7_BRACI|nr:hypothetical protein Bca52824_025794 [Brassica carinata]